MIRNEIILLVAFDLQIRSSQLADSQKYRQRNDDHTSVHRNNKKNSKGENAIDEQELIGYFKKLSDKSKRIVLGKAETLAEMEKLVVDEPAVEEEQKEQRDYIHRICYPQSLSRNR